MTNIKVHLSQNLLTAKAISEKFNIDIVKKGTFTINVLHYEIFYMCKNNIMEFKNIINNKECINCIIKYSTNPNTNKQNFKLKLMEFGIDEKIATNLTSFDCGSEWSEFSESALDILLPHLRSGKSEYEATKLEFNIEDDYISDPYALIPDNSHHNPTVRKVINRTLKLVKRLNSQYGVPDTIILELNRDLRLSAKERNKLYRRNNNNQLENLKIIDKIRIEGEYNGSLDRKILKMKLWEEQNHKCFYSDEAITLCQLFDTKLYDLDHIIPQSMSSKSYNMNNCVLVRQDINKEKNDSLAYPFLEKKLNDQEMKIYLEKCKELKTKYPDKYNRLMTKNIDDYSEKRSNSQSSHTSHINKEIGKRLEAIVGKGKLIRPTGYLTNIIRGESGIHSMFRDMITYRYIDFINKNNLDKYNFFYLNDNMLREVTDKNIQIDDNNFLDYYRLDKNIYDKHIDNRNHAMDALSLCYVTHKMITTINNNAKNHKKLEDGIILNEPFKNYKAKVHEVLQNMDIEIISDSTKFINKKKNYIYKIVNGKKIKVLNNVVSSPRKALHKELPVRIRLSKNSKLESQKAIEKTIKSYIPFYFEDNDNTSFEEKISFIKKRHSVVNVGKKYCFYPLVKISEEKEDKGDLKETVFNIEGHIKIKNHWFVNGTVVCCLYNPITKEKIAINLFNYLKDKTILNDGNNIKNGSIIEINGKKFIVKTISSSIDIMLSEININPIKYLIENENKKIKEVFQYTFKKQDLENYFKK